ncbi:dipeptidase [Candidatus Stoquefichus sp. SB1]|uniref:dipeptidase n=1 Tax=Candidatus Stoquefichus sp. SB1 TaxID=1658109 RepID=UPI00067E9F17|nr:dipeptidase [Candidatus Stoquefichus sp. SB1]
MKVIDMHCDTIYEIDRLQRLGEDVGLRDNQLNISLKKMQKGDYLLQNFAMFTHLGKTPDPIEHVQHLIDTFYCELEKNKDLIRMVYSYDDIEKNRQDHLMSALLTLEEGAVVNNDLSYLRNYYRLGVRMITLNWNFPNGIGYPNFDIEGVTHGYHVCDEEHGLTPFGISYVQECERLGIIIDVSHLSDAGFYDVLKYTTQPFVASHSNARQVCHHARNLTDHMIQLLAQRGGVMGINFAADFLDENETENALSKIDSMVKHILHIREIGGIDCIGLGSDFDGIPQNLELKDASEMPKLVIALQNAGLSEEDIEKIFYKNVLRVYKQVLK